MGGNSRVSTSESENVSRVVGNESRVESESGTEDDTRIDRRVESYGYGGIDGVALVVMNLRHHL